MKVFITKQLPEAGIALLQEAGIDLLHPINEDLSPEELIAQAKNADAVICVGGYKLDESFFAANTHLKGVALFSVGFDNVNIKAATEYNVPVSNTPDVLSNATADTALLLMLAVSRRALFLHKEILSGNWEARHVSEELGIDLNGKTLGIVGLGRIGTTLARKCKNALAMKILYHSRSRKYEQESELDATYVSFEELLKKSDVVSVHTNLSDSSREMFDHRAFQQMKQTAIFINTARGGLHNETDLKAALDAGEIWGAGLDVTNPEPMAAGNSLLQHPSVVVLPHIGSATISTRNDMATLAARNVMAALLGEKMPTVINREVYE